MSILQCTSLSATTCPPDGQSLLWSRDHKQNSCWIDSRHFRPMYAVGSFNGAPTMSQDSLGILLCCCSNSKGNGCWEGNLLLKIPSLKWEWRVTRVVWKTESIQTFSVIFWIRSRYTTRWGLLRAISGFYPNSNANCPSCSFFSYTGTRTAIFWSPYL